MQTSLTIAKGSKLEQLGTALIQAGSDYWDEYQRIVKAHPVLKSAAIKATDGRHYVAIPVDLEKGDVGEYIAPSVLEHGRKGHSHANRTWTDKQRRARKFELGIMSIRLLKKWTETMDKIRRPRKQDEEIGPYPNTRVIMPRIAWSDDPKKKGKKKPLKAKAVEHIHFNAELLAQMQQAMGAHGVTLTFYGEERPFEVEPLDPDRKAYGVLMPMLKHIRSTDQPKKEMPK